MKEESEKDGLNEAENEIVGWHHRLDKHEFEQALGVGDGQWALHASPHDIGKNWTWLRNRWGNSGNSVRIYFGGLQNHCRWWLSHEIKRCLLLGRKVMTNLHSVFKSRDITLPTKVRLVKAMVFPAVMYGCESWTVKKAERQRIDAFELWCWRDSWESLGLQGDPTSPC